MNPTTLPAAGGAASAETLTELLLKFMLKMGAEWVFWLLIVLSLVSVAIMVERLVILRFTRSDLERLQEILGRLVGGAPPEHVVGELQDLPGVEASVVRQGMERWEAGSDAVEEVVIGLMGLERQKLERGVAFLGTIGSNAPFIGLLGTVLGIVKAFNDLGKNVGGGAEAVMGGISEALVATAVGLLVAIPAVMAYNLFQKQIKQRMSTLTALIHLLLAGLKAHRH